MQTQVYHSQAIQAWEQRWFAQQNSAYGLMQQVAWQISQRLITELQQRKLQHIAICCGQGNNAGDGYLLALYLTQAGFNVDVYAAEAGTSNLLQQARQAYLNSGLNIQHGFDFQQRYEVYVDALFGIGLNRELSPTWQQIIQHINAQEGFKVAIDVPSGLNANTGQVMPIAIQADLTYSVLAHKAGLFTGQGKAYVGQLELIAALPIDHELKPIASLCNHNLHLPKRQAFAHKGSYGHVLVIGGHAEMGGAVILAAEAAFASGAGKVTVVCDGRHHQAILSRAPNIMLRDINALDESARQHILKQMDAVCFGMGLGRDAWAEAQFQQWFPLIQAQDLATVLDADALWFLAKYPKPLPAKHYCTPHPGEAALLLGCSIVEIENNRLHAVQQLQQKYAAQWLLKGAGSLILEDQLWICPVGNAGMATAGMGDVLSGMIAGLKAQFAEALSFHDIVTLHARAGDLLAEQGQRGIQAQDMIRVIYRVVNSEG